METNYIAEWHELAIANAPADALATESAEINATDTLRERGVTFDTDSAARRDAEWCKIAYLSYCSLLDAGLPAVVTETAALCDEIEVRHPELALQAAGRVLRPPAQHVVELVDAPEQRAQYGITHLSRYVFSTTKGSYPTRVVVWSNVNRPNPRNGEPVRFGEYGKLDGGNGRYLDPSNNATDEPTSIRLTPEASVITNNGTNTGTAASGQVYAPAGQRIAEGDLVALVYPGGSIGVTYVVHFTNNGHGELVPFNAPAVQS